jgi:Na+-driven multidrug efflux pump
MVYIPCVGMMSAIATLSGNAKGENDLKKLNQLTRLSSAMASGVMLIMSIFLYIFARNIIGIFTQDAEVIAIGTDLLRIVSLNEPIFAVSIVLESVFNGIGDTKSPFIASTVTQWVFRVLGTYLCVYVLGFGIRSAWVCMISDNIARCLLLIAFYVCKNKHLIYNKPMESLS